MVNINLSTGFELEKEIEKKKTVQKELLIPLMILCILFLAYGGLILYTGKLNNDKVTIAQDYEAKTADLLKSERAKKVFDFQNKLGIAGKLLEKKDKTGDLLTELESLIIPGTFISSYEYDNEKSLMKLELVSDQYNNVAKQILKLKESEHFSKINLSKSEIDEKGKIRMPVELEVK